MWIIEQLQPTRGDWPWIIAYSVHRDGQYQTIAWFTHKVDAEDWAAKMNATYRM